MPADGKVVPWHRCLLVALPGWAVARLIVLSTFALVDRPSPLVWDAAWYHDLGVRGYGPYGSEGSRFFPLLPAAVAVGSGLGVPVRLWQLAVCWVAALFFAAGLVRLTVRETGDEKAGHRVAWLIQLVPGANVLALGYSEALAGLLAVLYFLALRSPLGPRSPRAVGGGVAAGVLSGLARPTGPLLALAGLVEAVRSVREGAKDRGKDDRGKDKGRGGDKGQGGRGSQGEGGDRGGAKGRGAARWGLWLVALAPLVGTGGYLAWAWWAFGDPLTPYRVHPVPGLHEAPGELLLRPPSDSYPWALILALLVATGVALYLCGRRLPFAYLAWAVPMVGVAVIAGGLPSLPRLLAAVFPLWMAVAVVVRDLRLWLTVMTASLVGFTWVAWLTVAPGGPVP